MRKPLLFSAVLSLFLLVTASITRAQVTKTLNGTVSYRSGMSETKFSTPNGDVVINLPQSMSGSTITGTVSAQPTGKSVKEKSKNLTELLKMVVSLDGQKIPVSVSPTNFDWLTHLDRPGRTPMQLLNASGAKLAEVSLPPVVSAPAISDPGNPPNFSTPSRVLVKGDMLNVYTDKQFTSGEKFVLTDSKEQQFIVKPVALSYNQAVITVPAGAATGALTIRQETQSNASSTKVNLINIALGSPNTNLRPGEKSFVQVTIDPRIIERDTAEAMQIPIMSIDLRNLNPNTVTMEGGNLQRVYSNAFISTAERDPSHQFRRNITGNAVGSFSVSATLHEDYTTSNDPFRPQLNVLKTPEDFNAWANALKKDLKGYADMQDNDLPGRVVKTNAQRAIDNMPVSGNPEQLDESKAVAYSLIRPLNVPKGSTDFWPSGLEAYKAAIKNIPSTISGNPQLIDWEVIQKGLAYADRMGKLLGYDLQNGSADAAKLVTQIQTEGETKENLENLNGKLNLLDSRLNKAVTEMPAAMNLFLPGGLLFATKFTPPGMAKTDAEVTDIKWDVSPFVNSKGKDALVVEYHFTGNITVNKISVRVNWVSKDGKKSGVADAIALVDKDKDYKNCDKLPIWLIWPDDFEPAGMTPPPGKGDIDFGKDKDGKDKFKVKAFVNDKPVGEGTPGNNPK